MKPLYSHPIFSQLELFTYGCDFVSFNTDKADAFIAKLKSVFQNKENMVQEIGETPSPDKYPSEQAVKEYVDKVLNGE